MKKSTFTLFLTAIFFINGCATTAERKRIKNDPSFIALCMLIHPIASDSTIRKCADNLHTQNARMEKLQFLKAK